jgi:hypothetical protein
MVTSTAEFVPSIGTDAGHTNRLWWPASAAVWMVICWLTSAAIWCSDFAIWSEDGGRRNGETRIRHHHHNNRPHHQPSRAAASYD